MGVTKAELFSDFHNKLAIMAKALGHPARIAILEQLIKKGSCACGDVVDKLPLAQSTISQHLKAMKYAGIIKTEENGSLTCYCINKEECNKLWFSLSNLFKDIKNCC